MPDPTDPRSMKERMLAGGPYLADDAELQADSRHAAVMTAKFNQAPAADYAAREAILKSWFGAVGKDVTVRPPLVADYGKYVYLGDRVFINWNSVFVDVMPITIGDDTLIGPNCQFLAATHPLDIQDRLNKWEGGKPIVLGKNVWLGGGVIVCPGVTIGDHSVIGAGSVVTRDIPARSVAVGNPARVIKTI